MQVVEHRLADVPLGQDLVTLAVDHVALVVQDIVELERPLAHVEVAALDLHLRLGDRPGHHARLDGCRIVESETRHEPGDAVRGEDADQLVLERGVEP